MTGSGLVIDLDAESDNASEEVQTTSSSSDESGAEFSSARRVMQQPRVPSELKLIQHKKLKTLHVQETRIDTPCCHVCWRNAMNQENLLLMRV